MKKILLMCLVALLGIGVANAQKPKKTFVTVEFLTNIDCEGCAKKITDTLPYTKGVKDVKVDVKSKKVTVTYDATKTSDAALIKAFDKVKIKAEVAKK